VSNYFGSHKATKNQHYHFEKGNSTILIALATLAMQQQWGIGKELENVNLLATISVFFVSHQFCIVSIDGCVMKTLV